MINREGHDVTEAHELLLASGVWEGNARDLAMQFDPDRIFAVVDYCVNYLEYENPAAAIVKALREGWSLEDRYDPSRVQEILRGAR